MIQTVRSPTPSDPRATPFPTPRSPLEVLLYKVILNLRPLRPLFNKNWEMPIQVLKSTL